MAFQSDRRSLGKGLAALLDEAESSFSSSFSDENKVSMVGIEDIQFNENQPRKTVKESDISSLSASISAHGIIQPIILRPMPGDKYQIIAGERRYHAAKMAGLSKVPAIIRSMNEIESFEIAVIENVQRENLSIIEEASAYRKLVDEYGHTQDSLSQKMGKSRSYISNTMRLLKLPSAVLDMLNEGKLSAAHGRAIINTEDPAAMAQVVINKGLSVRETERIVQDSVGAAKSNKKASVKEERQKEGDHDMVHTERLLSRSLGADVRIKQSKNDYCNIVIKCRGMSILDEIISKLEGSKFDL